MVLNTNAVHPEGKIYYFKHTGAVDFKHVCLILEGKKCTKKKFIQKPILPIEKAP
jgi:hypothetical protein